MAQDAGVLKHVLSVPSFQYPFVEQTTINQKLLQLLATTTTPQGIIGLVDWKERDWSKQKSYLVLENIQEPGNLGALLRSALAFGFDNVVLSPNCVDHLNPKVLRASQGAIFKLNLKKRPLVPFLKQLSLPKIGTKIDKEAKPITFLDTQQFPHIALILGNEGQGVSREITNYCDHNIYLAIAQIDSLNVVVAGAILMHYHQLRG